MKITFKHNGIVDKFIGDALMAVFGTIEDEPDAEVRAVSAGLEFQEAIRNMNNDRSQYGKDPVSIGVGINTGNHLISDLGLLLAGFIGSQQRLEYTCIGDTVNTSSRICDLAEQGEVLISEFTYNRVRESINCEPFGMRQFKGKLKEVMVYRAVSVI